VSQVDLVDQAVVSAEEVEGLARKLGMRLYRTCVKENINVTEVHFGWGVSCGRHGSVWDI
jgi:Ras-related protein Rab-23